MKITKFRAWDKKVGILPVVDLSAPRATYIWLGLSDVPLMQFTGLFDKNSKEIYEGDIVLCKMHDDSFLTRVCEYRTPSYMFVGKEGESFGATPATSKERIEVVGNIYQNPELL